MKLPRDRVSYSAIVDRPSLSLPDGARLAVWLVVNVEFWDIQGPLARTVLPQPGDRTTHIPDLPNWTWHEYGMRVGFWRLKNALDSRGLTATLSINASVCQSYPRVAEAARDSGWEFLGHGLIQKPMHLLEEQQAEIRKCVDIIEDFTGRKPRGWMGPGLTETWETVDHLAEAGFEYVADWVMDDQPFEIATTAGPLVALPYSVELNDIPMMAVQHHKASELFDRVVDQFERLYDEGSENARVMGFAMHPYITGAPHRIGYFERALDRMMSKPGVVFWQGGQILDWYRDQKG
jgi:allantoinase